MRSTNGSATANNPESMCCSGNRSSPTSATTSVACGRKARMTVWSLYSWAPRTPCGLWCSPASRRAKSRGSGARCVLASWSVGFIAASPPAQQRHSGFGRYERHVDDVSDGVARIDAHVVGCSPLVFLAGYLVADPEPLIVLHTQCGHVQPQRRLFRPERVECDHHQHAVAGDRVELAVGQQSVVVDTVERDVPELVKSGMESTNLVQPRDKWLQRPSLRQCAREVARPELVLLGVEILLAALPHRDVLEQFVTGVHPPARAQGRRQHRADREHPRAIVLQDGMQDVRG